MQRFGSLNLNVHFHVLVLDGVFARDAGGLVQFHAAPAPAEADLEAIVARAQRRCVAWLRRHGHLDDRALEDQSNEIPAQTAIEGCAAIAMGRGNVATLARESADDARSDDEEERADRPTVAVERDGFNLHAGVRIEAGDDLGRERLARYGARPPLCLERLRRLPGGRVAYRLKYVSRGRGKHRVMSPMEFMARLAAIICPPRYPLVRYAGVLGPRSAWRKDVVPKPRERTGECDRVTGEVPPPRPDGDESPPTPHRSNRPHAAVRLVTARGLAGLLPVQVPYRFLLAAREAIAGRGEASIVSRLAVGSGAGYFLVVMQDVDNSSADRLLEAGKQWRLTPRERETLAFVVRGDSNKEIALKLALHEGSVERHVTSLLRKARCDSRSRLLARFWTGL